MNNLKLILRRLNELTGKMLKNSLELTGQITPDSAPKAEITEGVRFSGKTKKRTILTGRIIWLQTIYRFFKITKSLYVKLTAKACAALGAILEADKHVNAGTEAPLYSQPIASQNVNHSEYGSTEADAIAAPAKPVESKRSIFAVTVAGLKGYIRAGISYIKPVAVFCAAAVIVSPSVIIKAIRGITAACKAVAKTAATVAMRRFDSFTDTCTATGNVADGEELTAEKLTAAEVMAAAVGADGAFVEVASEPVAAHSASMAYWIEPVLENGVLTIRSVYSATQTGDELEVI